MVEAKTGDLSRGPMERKFSKRLLCNCTMGSPFSRRNGMGKLIERFGGSMKISIKKKFGGSDPIEDGTSKNKGIMKLHVILNTKFRSYLD